MRRLFALFGLLLASCGYHLVGHGGPGLLAPDEQLTLVVQGMPARDESRLRERLAAAGVQLTTHGDTVLFVRQQPARYVPSAYDRAGVATQYRMTISGEARLERAGKPVWESGPIVKRGDIYVAGGPASIEAARAQLEVDLQRQWRRDLLARLRSGF